MNDFIRIRDCDIIFLSYDEPNADANYQYLKFSVPRAKRVHGIEGSDSAHKECARISETENFLTIDGDTVVTRDFFRLEFAPSEFGATKEHVFSWCGKVNINGLMYGNGSIKLWTRKFALGMRTHENANPNDPLSNVDFCFDDTYRQLNANYSTSIINDTPLQAWRAGFREGVKMNILSPRCDILLKNMSPDNYVRALIWSSVGRDVPNGDWAMLGAREGCYLARSKTWDMTNVRDFRYLNKYWEDNYANNLLSKEEKLAYYREKLLETDITIAELDPEQSAFFKETYTPPSRVWKEYKIFPYDNF